MLQVWLNGYVRAGGANGIAHQALRSYLPQRPPGAVSVPVRMSLRIPAVF
jgi:hypothetical protein